MRSQFYNPEREPLTPANGRTAGVLPQAPSGDARANDSGFCGQIEMVPLNHLKPARQNARTHSKAQIAQIQADKKMPAKDKKEALADLNEAMKTPVPPIENKGNIDLVAKYYDKLADALGDEEE